jgi:hypothetical protein
MISRDAGGLCARCGAALDGAWTGSDARLWCVRCGGRFVGFAALARSHPALTALLGTSVAPLPAAPLDCPRCAQPMRALSVATITIDFCASHGVWFDSQELEELSTRVR